MARPSPSSIATPSATIRAFLAKHQPQNWPVLGEELGDDSQGSRYRWVIDPIDGTMAFSRGMPTFGTLLALEDTQEKTTLVGVIHLPALGETYSAAQRNRRLVQRWTYSRRPSSSAERLRDLSTTPSISSGSQESPRVKQHCALKLRICGHSQTASRTRWWRAVPSTLSRSFASRDGTSLHRKSSWRKPAVARWSGKRLTRPANTTA